MAGLPISSSTTLLQQIEAILPTNVGVFFPTYASILVAATASISGAAANNSCSIAVQTLLDQKRMIVREVYTFSLVSGSLARGSTRQFFVIG